MKANFNLGQKLNFLINNKNANINKGIKNIITNIKDLYDMSLEIENNKNNNIDYNFEDFNLIKE